MPVLVVQGTADTTVPVILTDALARQWRADDVDLTYRRVAGKGHVDVLEDARTSVDRWLQQTAPPCPDPARPARPSPHAVGARARSR